MVGDTLFYEFEFELPENFAEKYLAVDSIFEEFPNIEENHETEIGVSDEQSATKKCHKISLQKNPNSQCKLVIKIFADKISPISCDTSTQTKIKETRNERLQTQPECVSCRVQTETNVQNCRTQTPILTYNNAEVQSDECRLHQAFADAELSTDCSLSTQVDSSSLAVADIKDSTCQAVCDTVDNFCQNVALVNDSYIQTELELIESESQTEIKDFIEQHSQTSSSIARELDAEVQATIEITDQLSQTEVQLNESNSQTDLCYFHQTEAEIQATVLSFSNDSQTELNIDEQSTITDCNILTQRHTAVQSFIELNTQSQQTDFPDDKLTIPSIEKNSETSLNVAQADQTISSTHSTSDLKSANDSVYLDSSCDIGDVTNQTMMSTRNGSILTTNSNLVDGISQTDPVTIIIGDASFLVQKLKSSAVSSSKVKTSGNEIEIELSADAVDVSEESKEDKNQQPAVKSKAVENKPVQENVQMPKLLPMRTGGVRMRMPISQPNPSNKPLNPVITNQSPIVAPSPHQKTHHVPKVSSDVFSCPFCSLNFIESPALYEHLSQAHESDLQSKWKKSQGREGKTIIPRHLQTPKSSAKKSPANANKSNSNTSVEETCDSDVSFTGGSTKRKRGGTVNVARKHPKVKSDDDGDEEYMASGSAKKK